MFSDADGTREHIQLVFRVARLYHEEGATQAEIAQMVGYSRPTVSRLLTEAKARRMVTVTVAHPLERALEAEAQLQRKFPSVKVRVVSGEHVASGASVGRLAAATVIDSGTPHSVLALSNGTALKAFVDAMPQQRWLGSVVTPMIGSLGRPSQVLCDGPELCRRLAGKLGGTYRPLPIPLVMGSAEAARSVRKEEMVITTFELAARSDIALVGVGAVSPRGRSIGILEPYLTPSIESEIRRGKAVAHICGHHLDAQGRHVNTSLCDRTVTMPPERLADVGLAILIAWGPHKVRAIDAVLRSGLVNGLVTDEETVQLLMSYEC